MSAECMHLVNGYGVQREDKLILLQLADWAGPDKTAVANIYALADKTGYPVSTVVDALMKHQQLGTIWLTGHTKETRKCESFPIYRFSSED